MSGRQYKPIQYVVAFNRGLMSRLKAEVHPAVRKISAPKLPKWAENTLDRITATAFKPLKQLLPITAQNIWFKVGAAAGILERIRAFWAHDAEKELQRELPSDLYNDPERLVKLMGTEVLLPAYREMFGARFQPGVSFIGAVGDQFEEDLHNLKRRADQLYAWAFSFSTKAMCEFNEGSRHGWNCFLSESGELAAGTLRIVMYQEFLAAMPVIEEMRKAKPKKTRKDLHEMFTVQLGQNVVGDYKRFCAICDDIGLVLSPRGRPCSPEKTKRRVR